MSTADVVTGNSVATSAVSLSGLRKVYGDVVAVAQVDLEVRTGEIHALLGENGAGKTTLMRLLYGLAKPDAGSISIDGNQVAITSPKVARAAGIGMVTQHFSLVKTMTVTENLVLQDAGFFSLDLAGARKKLLALCEEIGLEIDPDARIDSLPVAMQQRVEILKALAGGCKVLILDEPTAVLGPQDVDSLLDVIRRLRDTIGLSVILITHKMHEISKVADRVSVLRRGEIVATENANGMSIAALTSLMVEGVQQEVVEEGVRSSHGASVLSIKDLTVHLRGHDVISDLSLEVRRGEIVGIAGVSGNGQ
ncbi:MAG: ATP-binding cassette domain-containing protein, partial [Actinobacteria bacterium]|nr:ATP-binding cassette domain-containing protein [Actinomycetota bacterium]